MPKISIIVPVYGVEKYIKKCIDSLVNQTFKDFEIIVVDDGTKDNSIKIIEDNFNDQRIKIFHKENGGNASAKNFGIEKATGEYLFFVDSDDYLDTDCLYEMYSKIIEDKTDMVICDYYKLFEDGKVEYEKMIPFYDENNKKCSVISMPGPVCKLTKRERYQKYNIQFLENHYFEDNAIMPFLCATCKSFSYIQKPFYFYLQRNGSILNKKKYDPKWEDIFDALDYLYNKFKKHHMINEFYEEIEYIYIEYLLHAPSLRFLDYPEGIENIKKISSIMKENFPNWRKNKYYKQEGIKYKIICNLFYKKHIKLAKFLLRR